MVGWYFLLAGPLLTRRLLAFTGLQLARTGLESKFKAIHPSIHPYLLVFCTSLNVLHCSFYLRLVILIRPYYYCRLSWPPRKPQKRTLLCFSSLTPLANRSDLRRMHTNTRTCMHAHLQVTHTQTSKQTNTQTGKHANKQTNWQTRKQANKQTHKLANTQTNKQTGKHANKQTNWQTRKQANKQTHKLANTQTNKQTGKHANKQTNWQTRKQANKQTHKLANTQTNKQTGKHATSKQTGKHANKQTNKHTNWQTRKQTNKLANTQTHVQTGKEANTQAIKQSTFFNIQAQGQCPANPSPPTRSRQGASNRWAASHPLKAQDGISMRLRNSGLGIRAWSFGLEFGDSGWALGLGLIVNPRKLEH